MGDLGNRLILLIAILAFLGGLLAVFILTLPGPTASDSLPLTQASELRSGSRAIPADRRLPGQESGTAEVQSVAGRGKQSDVRSDAHRGKVVDASGAGIFSCRVSLVSREGFEAASTESGPAGEFSFPEETRPADWVVVTCPGYATALRAFPTPWTSPLTIQLESAGRLAGVVTTPRGEPPRSPVLVVARESWRPLLTSGEIRRIRTGDPVPGVHHATTSTGGSFEITALSQEEEYHVYVGGDGYSLQGIRGHAEPAVHLSDSPLEIVVAPLYVVNVGFYEENGEPVETSPYLWSSNGHALTLSGFSYMGVDHTDVAGELALGPDLVQRSPYLSSNGIFRLLTSEEDVDRLGPCEARLSLPGYEILRAEIWAMRVQNGELPEQRFTMRRVVGGFGSLEIQFRAEHPRLIGEPGSSLVEIYLVPQGWNLPNGAPRIQLWTAVGESVVQGIPEGTYAVGIPRYGMVLKPEIDSPLVTIAARAPARLTVNTGAWGAVELVLRSGSRKFGGPVFVDLVRKKVPISDQTIAYEHRFRLSGPDYQLSGLPGGEYALSAYPIEATKKEREAIEATSFFITDGELQTVELDLSASLDAAEGEGK